jgi:hypothetical protein
VPRGAAFAVLALLLLAYAGWTQRPARAGQGGVPLPDEPVLVVVVKGAAELGAVRAAIDPERVVANSLEGVAALNAKPTLDEAIRALRLLE